MSTAVNQILGHFGGRLVRVYIVDDDPVARRTIARLLATENIDSVGYGSACDFLAELATIDYGCVLLDIDMPGECGLDVLGDILQRQPPFPVVMASGSTQVDDAITSFRRGALHFLRKPYRKDELLTVIGEAAAVGAERMEAFERQRRAEGIKLTTRERQVLEAMADGQQSKQIAWNLGLSIRTVEMHRSNLLIKLAARNATQAIAIARSLDLLSKPQVAA